MISTFFNVPSTRHNLSWWECWPTPSPGGWIIIKPLIIPVLYLCMSVMDQNNISWGLLELSNPWFQACILNTWPQRWNNISSFNVWSDVCICVYYIFTWVDWSIVWPLSPYYCSSTSHIVVQQHFCNWLRIHLMSKHSELPESRGALWALSLKSPKGHWERLLLKKNTHKRKRIKHLGEPHPDQLWKKPRKKTQEAMGGFLYLLGGRCGCLFRCSLLSF